MLTERDLRNLQELHDELPGLYQDAMRYRFLRDQGSFSVDRRHRDPYNKNWRGEFCLFTIASQHVYGDTLDAAVDAAIEKTRR